MNLINDVNWDQVRLSEDILIDLDIKESEKADKLLESIIEENRELEWEEYQQQVEGIERDDEN